MARLFTSLLLLLIIHYSLSFKEWWEESKVLELTSENFNNYIGKDKYVFVKFYTKWCVWCQRLSPVYEQLYFEYVAKREDVLIARLEAQSNGLIASKYGIFSFPYLGLFLPGSDLLKDAFSGQRDLNTLINLINERTPIVKKSNLQGGGSHRKIEVNSTGNGNGNETESTNQEDYFKREIEKMNTQLRNIEEDINEIKRERGLITLTTTAMGYINKDIEDELRSKVISISITPRSSVVIIFVSVIMILFYFSILKYLNKHN